MVGVGSSFMGGNVEQIVVRAVFDGTGVKTGTKEIRKVSKELENLQKKTTTYQKVGGNAWVSIGSEIKKDTARIRRLNNEVKEGAKRVQQLKQQMRKAKLDKIAGLSRFNQVTDFKGKLTEGTSYTRFTPGLDEFQKKIVDTNTSMKRMKNGLMEVTTQYRNFEGNVVKTTKTIKRQQEQFSMWALSFIFAGMQIKMVSQQIARSTTATFMKITQGQTDAGRAITGLSANFKFLQFQIGQAIGTALKPLMPILISLIRYVANFVNQHPEATFAAIAAAFTLGTGLFLGGQMVLFSDALVSLVNKGGGLGKVLAPLAFLGNPVVAAVIGGLIALSAVSWRAFSETPEAWEAIKGAMSEIGTTFKDELLPAFENMIQTIFPEFELNWENIAWTIAWVFDMLADGIKMAINNFSFFVNAIAGVINALKALYYASPAGGFNFSKVASLMGKADEAFSAAAGNVMGTRASAMSLMNTASLGAMGYRDINTYGGFQEAEPFSRDGSNPFGVGGGQMSSINANVVNINMSRAPGSPPMITDIQRAT